MVGLRLKSIQKRSIMHPISVGWGLRGGGGGEGIRGVYEAN